jgi:ParB/RepB/Spo0J family partition protein
MSALPIDKIQIGTRHRREMGDIASLAGSMGELGLLQPVVVRPDGHLIAGERRLRAAQLLGWETIPVTVVDLDEIARGEFAENAIRKDFTLSEAVAIKRALEPIERAKAKKRMLVGKPSEKFSEGGNALDKIAKATGMHRTTLAKAEAIVDAERPSPRSSANCSRTWTAPAAPMASIGGSRSSNRRQRFAENFRHSRAVAPTASSWLIRRGPPPSEKKIRRAGRICHIPRCQSNRFASCPWHQSPHRTAFSGSGRPIFICAKPTTCSMRGNSSPRRFSPGPRTRWARAIGCAGKPITASWLCAATPS